MLGDAQGRILEDRELRAHAAREPPQHLDVERQLGDVERRRQRGHVELHGIGLVPAQHEPAALVAHVGNGLREAEELAALAKQQGVLAVAGLQARAAPPVLYVRDLIRQGYVGEVLSSTLIGSGMGWGGAVPPYNAYLNGGKNGATLPP